jgi:hypothetical protein
MQSLLSQSKPQLFLAKSVGFFGSGRFAGYPAEQITQLTSDWLVLFNQPFQPSTQGKLTARWKKVNAAFQCIASFLALRTPSL